MEPVSSYVLEKALAEERWRGSREPAKKRLYYYGAAAALAAVLLAVLAFQTGIFKQASRTLPHLTNGNWILVNARDDNEQREDWSNSVLKFTSQEETPDGLHFRVRLPGA